MKHLQWDTQPAVTQLSSEPSKEQLLEILKKVEWKPQKLFLELVKQVGWQRTGTEIFESFFPILPFVPSEQAIVRIINNEPHVLMWYRSDPNYTGYHMPGGYLLKGENNFEWCARVLKKETGLGLQKIELIRTFNTRPETGWVPNQQMAHFWLCTVEGEPTRGQFFPVTQLPEDTLGHHKKYVEYLRAFFLRRETMKRNGIWNDGLYFAPEWKWLVVGETPKWGKSEGVFNKLDEALACVENFRNVGLSAVLSDDLGHEIV